MNHTQSLTVLEAGIAKSAELGVAMSIAVVDARTDLVAQVRMDGAARFTVEVARGKATVSAIFGQPSAAVTGEDPVSPKLNRLYHDGLVFAQGAVPLVVDGAVVGAVGVSGALPEMDEQVALAAAEALAAPQPAA